MHFCVYLCIYKRQEKPRNINSFVGTTGSFYFCVVESGGFALFGVIAILCGFATPFTTPLPIIKVCLDLLGQLLGVFLLEVSVYVSGQLFGTVPE